MTWRIAVVTTTETRTLDVTVRHPRELRSHIDLAGRGLDPFELRAVSVRRID